MLQKVKVFVLRTAGTNCDCETSHAFSAVGAEVDCSHINTLLSKEKKLSDYHILALPGGFTYGDDIAAGKVLANELRLKLGEDIKKFIADGKLIIGICNGFQVLVKAGFLPGITLGKTSDFTQNVTLMLNDSGKFEDRWTYLKSSDNCIWTKGICDIVYFPVAHGEGKFMPMDDHVLRKLKDNKQIVFRYCTESGEKPVYPDNPNGSADDIAGITDKTGRILGLMPHPERHFIFEHHPRWTRLSKKSEYGDGAKIFKNGIEYIKKNFKK